MIPNSNFALLLIIKTRNMNLIEHADIAFFTLPDGNIAHVEFSLHKFRNGTTRDFIMNECINSSLPNSEVTILSTKDYTNNGEGDRYRNKYLRTFNIYDNKNIDIKKDYLDGFWLKFDDAFNILEQKQIISDFISDHR